MADGEKRERAYFAAGCFWGPEAVFGKINGVVETAVGYQGGTVENPSYEEVCTGRTGHAEVVEVVFDPAVISYQTLLETFWKIHDPTTLNRQGPDVGTQYRSAIYTVSDAQNQAARDSLEEQDTSGRFRDSIVTEIAFARPFYRAEDYHQKYFERRGIVDH